MVQGDGNPDDRREQLGQGETSDCLSTRRRWQKSSTKVSKVSKYGIVFCICQSNPQGCQYIDLYTGVLYLDGAVGQDSYLGMYELVVEASVDETLDGLSEHGPHLTGETGWM